jgi:hypothetical protein
LITGIIVEVIGIIPVYWLCGISGIILLGYSWFFTRFRKVEELLAENVQKKFLE